jgi:Rrf2 family protein
MLSFTKRADYALLALCYLTAAKEFLPERLVTTKEIAEHYNIPIELLAKIMQSLSRRQLVASFPGPTGGYRMMGNPAEISIASVVKMIDGQMGIVHCSNGNDAGCDQFERCTIRNPLATIEERMYELLEQMSILDIMQPSPDNFVPLASLSK